MFRHKGCVRDPEAIGYWRDYQNVLAAGNPLGLSFVEYVAYRVAIVSAPVAPVTVTTASGEHIPWYTAQCGHRHPWGVSCNTWTTSQ